MFDASFEGGHTSEKWSLDFKRPAAQTFGHSHVVFDPLIKHVLGDLMPLFSPRDISSK